MLYVRNSKIGRTRTPLRQVFSYGIRHIFIVIHWTMSNSSLNNNENIPYPVWKKTCHTGVRILPNVSFLTSQNVNVCTLQICMGEIHTKMMKNKDYCLSTIVTPTVNHLRGYCTLDQFCDCLCTFLKNHSTLVTSKICFL